MEYVWLDISTPTPGFLINHQGWYIVNIYLVYALISQIYEVDTEEQPGVLVQLHIHQYHVSLQFLQWLQLSLILMAIVLVDKAPDFSKQFQLHCLCYSQ